jgi:hypothetical protein
MNRQEDWTTSIKVYTNFPIEIVTIAWLLDGNAHNHFYLQGGSLQLFKNYKGKL